MVQSKLTFKAIPHYPDLVIREAVCNINDTWEDFLKSFGVDLSKAAPGVNFLVRSRKGASPLSDKIEVIASKYVQRYRILVTVEQDLGKVRVPRRRRRRPPQPKPECNLPAGVPGAFPNGVQRSDGGVRPVAPPSANPGLMRSPHLMSALKRSIVKRMRAPNQPTADVALQMEMLREMARYEQSMMVSDEYNCGPPIRNNVGHPSPFPSFSSILGPGNLNFETRVEKIEDYNVIRKSSVVWQDHGGMRADTPMCCFSMMNNDFTL